MREIKFRAWTGHEMITEFMLNAEDGGLFLTQYSIHGAPMDLVLHFKLMQFTGLQDINGVDIYEGDIVCIEKDRFGVGRHEVWSVVYGYFGDAAFYVQNHINSGRLIEVDQYHPHFSPDGTLEIPLEVVGNIHQNPELLQ